MDVCSAGRDSLMSHRWMDATLPGTSSTEHTKTNNIPIYTHAHAYAVVIF